MADDANGPQPGWSPEQPPGAGYPTQPTYPTAPTSPNYPDAPASPQYGANPGWAPPPPAPKPGVIPLRPLSVGEILDGAISYVRANPKATLGIAAVVGTISVLVQLAATIPIASDLGTFQDWAQNPESVNVSDAGGTLAKILAISALSGVVTAILGLIASGALTHIMGRAVQGKPMSLGEAWDATRPRLFALIGVSVIIGVVTSGLVIIALAPGFGLILLGGGTTSVAAVGGLLLLLGLCAGVALAIFLGVRWSLATPALMLEGTSVTGALQRSWNLVSGAFWRTLGIVLLGTVIGGAISGLVSGIFGAFGATGSTVGLFMASIGTVLGFMLATPFIAGVITLVYVDRRMRTEGFDARLRDYTGT